MISMILLVVGLYFLYLGIKFLSISNEEYEEYRNKYCSGGFKDTLFGDNIIDDEHCRRNIAMRNGKLIIKQSATSGITRSLFKQKEN